MPKYAYFDAQAAPPQPILGWYDTDLTHYRTLPAAADLLLLSEAQWAAHIADLRAGWTIVDGAPAPPPPFVPPAPTPQAAPGPTLEDRIARLEAALAGVTR